jgi:phage terminase small subunit
MKKETKKRYDEFVNNYFLHHTNLCAAYMATYPKCTRKAAYSAGSRLLRNDYILKEIERRLHENHVSGDLVLSQLSEEAQASVEPFLVVGKDGFAHFDLSQPSAQDHLHMIKKLSTKRSRRIEPGATKGEKIEWEDETISLEVVDAMEAQDRLGKYHKLFGDSSMVPRVTLQVEGLDAIINKVYGPWVKLPHDNIKRPKPKPRKRSRPKKPTLSKPADE